jgi:ribonuclease P/MRP protein subunit RPP1
MMDTDACIHPYPAGNSSARRMAIEAGELGFGGIVIPGAEPGEYHGVRIIPAIIISETDIRKVAGQIRKCGNGGNLVLADAGDNGFNRAILTQKGVHVVRRIHRTPRNAFDHVCARLAGENGIAVDIDLSPLLQEKGVIRQKVLSRYNDLMRLHSRYSFPLTVSSNASSILELRSPDEIRLLCTLFGMDKEDTSRALQTVGTLLAPAGPVTVVS